MSIDYMSRKVRRDVVRRDEGSTDEGTVGPFGVLSNLNHPIYTVNN